MPDETMKMDIKDIEPQSVKEKAEVLLRLIQEFETFLSTRAGEIDLEEQGWKSKVHKIYAYSSDVWSTTQIEAFQAVSWWAGNIEKSYMNKYDVKIGLQNIQGDRGFRRWIEEEIGKVK